MENASKALIMAGGALIAVLVLSLFAYVFLKMGESSSRIYKDLDESDITEFNQQFFKYNGRDDLLIQDVVSIINLAKNNNFIKNLPVTVTVQLDSETNRENLTTDELNDLLKANVGNKRYTCEVDYANNSKLVGSIKIMTNP